MNETKKFDEDKRDYFLRDKNAVWKPYIVTFELEDYKLDNAVARAKAILGDYSDSLTSVVQKYRSTNVATEWHNEELMP